MESTAHSVCAWGIPKRPEDVPTELPTFPSGASALSLDAAGRRGDYDATGPVSFAHRASTNGAVAST